METTTEIFLWTKKLMCYLVKRLKKSFNIHSSKNSRLSDEISIDSSMIIDFASPLGYLSVRQSSFSHLIKAFYNNIFKHLVVPPMRNKLNTRENSDLQVSTLVRKCSPSSFSLLSITYTQVDLEVKEQPIFHLPHKKSSSFFQSPPVYSYHSNILSVSKSELSLSKESVIFVTNSCDDDDDAIGNAYDIFSTDDDNDDDLLFSTDNDDDNDGDMVFSTDDDDDNNNNSDNESYDDDILFSDAGVSNQILFSNYTTNSSHCVSTMIEKIKKHNDSGWYECAIEDESNYSNDDYDNEDVCDGQVGKKDSRKNVKKYESQKRVTFSNRVQEIVDTWGWSNEELRESRKAGIWEQDARDRCRFQRRICTVAAVIEPVLQASHRSHMRLLLSMSHMYALYPGTSV